MGDELLHTIIEEELLRAVMGDELLHTIIEEELLRALVGKELCRIVLEDELLRTVAVRDSAEREGAGMSSAEREMGRCDDGLPCHRACTLRS